MDIATEKKLMETALVYRKRAYTPYSHFNVGAALLAKDGTVFGGCNIENAGYTATNCAERTAFFKAVSEGYYDFEAIAIVGGYDGANDGNPDSAVAPCGVCRQVMAEFVDFKEFKILLGTGPDDYKIYSLEEILPLGFSPKDLNNK